MERLKEIFFKKNKINALVVGDIMLDEYVWGKVDRISPEAPVQIIKVDSRNYVLGGAANVAHNLADMGATVEICSVIGDDDNGKILNGLISRTGIGNSGVFPESGRKTTLKTRVIAHNQQVVRVDEETAIPVKKETREKTLSYIEKRIKLFDGIILSDYAKGLLAEDLIANLMKLCKKAKKIILVDPKGMNYRKYRGATIITPNLKELELASGIKLDSSLEEVNENEIRRASEKVMEETNCNTVIVTRGKDGMSVCRRGKNTVHIKAEAKEVYDVSGAGDTAIAALGLALFSGFDEVIGARLANIAAGIVVGKIGAATATKEEILKKIDDDFSIVDKFLMPKQLPFVVSRLKANNKKIVFTNGCFDLLHIGHIFLLQKAKSFGDVLIVGLNSDESVRNLKGDKRPLISEKERALVLSALNCVDYIVIFSEDTPLKLLNEIKPDVLVKGGDYKRHEVVGHKEVESYGGRVELIPVFQGSSTTMLIEKIVSKYNNS